MGREGRGNAASVNRAQLPIQIIERILVAKLGQKVEIRCVQSKWKVLLQNLQPAGCRWERGGRDIAPGIDNVSEAPYKSPAGIAVIQAEQLIQPGELSGRVGR